MSTARSLTGEMKQRMAKEAAKAAEASRSQIRHERQHAMKQLRNVSDKDDKARLERQVQTLTDAAIARVDGVLARKLAN